MKIPHGTVNGVQLERAIEFSNATNEIGVPDSFRSGLEYFEGFFGYPLSNLRHSSTPER